MALPPIISNMPFLKLFKVDKAAQPENTKNTANADTGIKAANPQQDVVDISSAAAERLQGAKVLSLENEEELRSVIGETRHILASTNQSLGLKTDFR